MRISDWSSDVCSSDLSEETAMEMAAGVLSATDLAHLAISTTGIAGPDGGTPGKPVGMVCFGFARRTSQGVVTRAMTRIFEGDRAQIRHASVAFSRSEEHTSELQSLMRLSYAVFCLTKKNQKTRSV